MKVIETVYKGYRFRSRLEARWAVFFDTLGIPYEYEKEGYDLDGVWYLPDFWLPRHEYWIEIKGERPTDEEEEKASRLAKQSGKLVAICFGEIDAEVNAPYIYYLGLRSGEVVRDINVCWEECPYCHKVGLLRYKNHPSDFPCKCWWDIRRRTPKLQEAYSAARQARFERH